MVPRMLRNSASLLDTVRAMRTRARMSAVQEYSPRSVSSCSARRTYSLRKVPGALFGLSPCARAATPVASGGLKAVSPRASASSWSDAARALGSGSWSRRPVSMFVLFTTTCAWGMPCSLSSW